MNCYIMPLRASLWHVSSAGRIHVAVKKEELEVLRSNLLLPQVREKQEERACKRAKGRTDSHRFRLSIPAGLKEGIKLTHILKGKLILSTSSHYTTATSLLVILVETS